MTVARMTPRDIPEVAALEALVFAHPWSAHALELLCGNEAVGFVCRDAAGGLLAYGGMLLAPDAGQILNIASHPAHRRQGAASAVLRALVEEAASRGLGTVLEVRESNTPARALYGKAGFAAVGRRPHFYTHPDEAALILRRDPAPTGGTVC